MNTVALPSGERVGYLGQGTWHMGEDPGLKQQEIKALQQGLDLGLNLIDTAEMYAEGGAETIVGQALGDRPSRRDKAFIVSKVYPHHASRHGTQAACERSLERLKTDRIDLYLLHWRGQYPLAETVQALQALQQAGKIRHWGVSNFDLTDMHELWRLNGGQQLSTNQVLYNLSQRGIEWDLLPWMRQHGIPTMAYSPLEQARLANHQPLQRFAREHGMTAAQAALAWVLHQPGVVAIPKSSNSARLQENALAAQIRLNPAQLQALDALFAPPRGPSPLAML